MVRHERQCTPTPLRQTAHGNEPFMTTKPTPEINILVFGMFTSDIQTTYVQDNSGLKGLLGGRRTVTLLQTNIMI